MDEGGLDFWIDWVDECRGTEALEAPIQGHTKTIAVKMNQRKRYKSNSSLHRVSPKRLGLKPFVVAYKKPFDHVG